MRQANVTISESLKDRLLDKHDPIARKILLEEAVPLLSGDWYCSIRSKKIPSSYEGAHIDLWVDGNTIRFGNSSPESGFEDDDFK